MEALRHAVVAVVLGDPGRVQLRVVAAHPARQGGPKVPSDARHVPVRQVGPVAFGGDASVPIVEGSRGALLRHAAGERVVAVRLVEVGVNRQS